MLLLRENRRGSTRLNKPLTAQCRSHRLIEPSNQKSQIAQEYGLLLADARQQLNCYNKEGLTWLCFG